MKYDIYKDGDDTICRCKVNGQLIKMTIYKDIFPKSNYYSVCLFINKRKKGYQEGLQTGKIGLTGLLIAKQMLLDFIDELRNQKGHNIILIYWADKRRRDVYYRSLSKYGFKYNIFNGCKCLKLIIN
jgi:hypothetical protein